MAKKEPQLLPNEQWRSAEYVGATPEPGAAVVLPKRDTLLVERETTYGDFKKQGACAHGLKNRFRREPNYERLSPAQREALDMVATKISRLLHGNPQLKDTWDDIAGYAKLGSESCE
jgi:hypothetical protein